MTAGVVVGAAIIRRWRLLAAQRAKPAELAGLWELPGGAVEPGESEQAALRRECREELAVEVAVGARVGADVELGNGRTLRIYTAALAGEPAEPRAVDHLALRWIGPRELDTLPWLPADRELLPALRQLLQPPPDEG